MLNAHFQDPIQASALDCNRSLERLTPLARKVGCSSDIYAFHKAVNLAFHAAESEVYDEIHASMRGSLPAQIALLVADCERIGAFPTKPLSLLDVGCGTGLSSELLLGSCLGHRIGSVSLLDTSPEMLAMAERKVSHLGYSPETFLGDLSTVPQQESFDIVVACSVLHHLPDIPGFLKALALRQGPGGIFLHLQDPSADWEVSTAAKLRRAQFQSRSFGSAFRAYLRNLCPRSFVETIRGLTGRVPKYILKTNSILLQQGVIHRPMGASEIWSITDLHVHDGCGISIESLQAHLQDGGYQLIQRRTYGFFGALESELPRVLALKEAQLAEEHAQDGSQISGVWIKSRNSS